MLQGEIFDCLFILTNARRELFLQLADERENNEENSIILGLCKRATEITMCAQLSYFAPQILYAEYLCMQSIPPMMKKTIITFLVEAIKEIRRTLL